MEIQTANFKEGFQRFVTVTRGLDSNPLLAWQLMLWLFFVSFVICSFFAYSTYRWSVSSETLVSVKQERVTTVSREEIAQVVQLYEGKRAEFEALQNGKVVIAPEMIKKLPTPTETNQNGQTQLNN